MPDESVVSSTTENTEVVAESPAIADTSAETQNTESPQAEQNTVPSYRLKEEADKRRFAEQEIVSLKTRLEALEQPPAAPEPPVDESDERVRAREMIESDARALLEKELGMPLADIKGVLSNSSSTSKDYVQREWNRRCEDAGLDKDSRDVQEMVFGLGKAGVEMDEAFQRAKKYLGTAEPTAQTASVESGGVSTVMTSQEYVPKTRAEVAAMSKDGKLAPLLSSQELINRAIKANEAKVVRRE